MTIKHFRRSGCRLCNSSSLSLVISLEPSPPANAFVKRDALELPQERYPLDVFLCTDCSHLQLLDVLDPQSLFRDYVYVSGTSPVFVKHFEEYARTLISRYGLVPGSLIVDVGSNDGTLLNAFKKEDMKVLGIDPAVEIAQKATKGGIQTICGFFDQDISRKIRDTHGCASIVTANNVFAHIDDLAGVLSAVRILLAPDGVFVFEVMYLADLYEKGLFDIIYHEHLSYHSVKPLRDFFLRNEMELVSVERVNTHGGSLRGVAQRVGGPHTHDGSVEATISQEETLGLDRVDTFKNFGDRTLVVKDELLKLLRGIKAEGKRIAGFGAPAKATTLMHHLGIGREFIDFIVDDNPLKQGLYSPGLHVPIVTSQYMYQNIPDYLIILAWNFSESIMKNNASFSSAGGHFIVPLPQINVY